jgi:hypothetical protein
MVGMPARILPPDTLRCSCSAECKENDNPQFSGTKSTFGKSAFGSSLQPTRLSFSAAALKQHDRQARVGPGKSQPAQKKPMKTVKEAGKQPLATAPAVASKKRILSERTNEVKGGDQKRVKIEADEQPPSQLSSAAADIDIADELADLFEEQDNVPEALVLQPGQLRVHLLARLGLLSTCDSHTALPR